MATSFETLQFKLDLEVARVNQLLSHEILVGG